MGSKIASFKGRATHDGPEAAKMSTRAWKDSEISSTGLSVLAPEWWEIVVLGLTLTPSLPQMLPVWMVAPELSNSGGSLLVESPKVLDSMVPFPGSESTVSYAPLASPNGPARVTHCQHLYAPQTLGLGNAPRSVFL